MSAPEACVTVAARLRGRHRAAGDRRSWCVDDGQPGVRRRDGDDEGRQTLAARVAGGRRRRQRTSGRRRKSGQQQPEVMTSTSRGVDDDDDDAGSVCSGASSASENSAVSRGSGGGGGDRRARRPRGPPRSGRSSSSRRDGNGDTTSQTERPLVPSKYRPDSHLRSTGASTPSDDETVSGSRCGVVRPEPEGGVRAAPYKSATSDEFERLIYGPSEPLFSDGGEDPLTTLDDEVDVTKDCTTTISSSAGVRPSPQQRRPRFSRAAVVDEATDSIFGAAQMVNTNNMMKFAIIQMELKNVKDVSLRRVRPISCRPL